LVLVLAFLAIFVGAQACSSQSQTGGRQNSQGPPPKGQGGQGSEGGPRRPPPEALAACQGKSSGAACSFVGRQKETLTGTCFAPRTGESGSSDDKASPSLACRPAHDGQDAQGSGGRPAPPPEALAACQDKSSGAACSFVGRQKETLTGTCFAPRTDESGSSGDKGSPPLACRPAHGGQGDPHTGGTKPKL